MLSEKVARELAKFQAKISLSNPLNDYVRLVAKKIRPAAMRREVYMEYWKKISAATRAIIWKLLFNHRKNTLSARTTETCAELMKMLKDDSCIYGATDYNKWIVDVRNELLRRDMLDFWYVLVHRELGPCCARDSDLFTDIEDSEVERFYNYGNCIAPWLMEVKRIKLEPEDDDDSLDDIDIDEYDADDDDEEVAAITSTLDNTKNSKPVVTLRKISHDNAVEDYKYNMEAVVLINPIDPDYLPVFEGVRETIWNILFTEPTLSAVNYKRAAELLLEYKKDAVYHNPWDYNDWIPAVRDELLKKKFFDFWKNVMVEQELGLCWARDCDYYHDMEDPEPVEFYKFANCEAAWLKEKEQMKP